MVKATEYVDMATIHSCFSPSCKHDVQSSSKSSIVSLLDFFMRTYLTPSGSGRHRCRRGRGEIDEPSVEVYIDEDIHVLDITVNHAIGYDINLSGRF